MSHRSTLRLGWLMVPWMLFASGAPAHEIFKECADCPRMVRIPGGTFTMGSPESERERRSFEGPQPNVKVASFAIGETEVTRRQFAAFVADTKRPATDGCFTFAFASFTDDTVVDLKASWRNVPFEQTDEHPVVCVSWQEAKEYAAWLSHKTGQNYRLPSEAEWEYAARAGTTSTFYWGNDEHAGCAYMNGGDATLLRALPKIQTEVIDKDRATGDTRARLVTCNDGVAFTAPAGSYRPNAFGLYDISGNVWEPVEDCWHEALPTSGLPQMKPSCDSHRTRGGSWDDYPVELRSARRSRVKPDMRRNDTGFRVARTLSAAEAAASQ